MRVRNIFLGLGFFVLLSLGVTPQAVALAPKDGVVKAYHFNGRLWVKVYYKNGKKVLWQQYSQEGKLLLDYRYKDGVSYYKRTCYPNGKTESLWTRKSGMLINYYPDGSVKAKVESKGLSIEQTQ